MESTTYRVHLAVDNETIRRRMAEILEEEEFDVLDLAPNASPDDEEAADLLVADVDGDLASSIEALVDRYRDRGDAVLRVELDRVGASTDRDEASDVLMRPFRPRELLASARDVLGLASAAAPPSEETDEQEGEEDVLEIEDASSMILDVEELGDTYVESGRFANRVECTSLDVDELRIEAEQLESADEPSRSTRDATLPEVPSHQDVLDSEEGTDSSSPEPEPSDAVRDASENRRGTPSSRPPSNVASGAPEDVEPRADESTSTSNVSTPASTAGGNRVGGRDETGDRPIEPTPASQPETEGSHSRPSRTSTASSAPLSPELARRMSEAADLVARHWAQMGLAARAADRADRIERVLTHLLKGGQSAAERVLDRIPSSQGFSGRLEMMSPFELLETIRRRGLRGRLELSHRQRGFVLYVDGGRLDGIEDLAGGSDTDLLDCLRDAGLIDEPTHRTWTDSLEQNRGTPLEMRLRTEEVLTREELQHGRRLRAERILSRAFELEAGHFAFIGIEPDGEQRWPVNALSLDLVPCLLDRMREASETSTASHGEGAEFMTVEDVAAEVDRTRLTELEEEILQICIDLHALGDLKATSNPPDAVERTVERLERVGLLARVGDAHGASFPSSAEPAAADGDDAVETSPPEMDTTRPEGKIDVPETDEEVDASSTTSGPGDVD